MLGGSLADADPLVLGHVVQQFLRLDLADDARAGAVEAAVAAGL